MALLTINPGDKPTAAQFNAYMTHTGSAWDTWTPTVTQTGSVSVTNSRSYYWRAGRLIVAQCSLIVTGSGTSATPVVISLPVTAASGGVVSGTMIIVDNSAPYTYVGAVLLGSTTTMQGYMTGNTTTNTIGTASPSFGLANTDTIYATVMYEAATG